MSNIFAEILEFIFESGRVIVGPDGLPDPDSVAAEVRFEAGERGVDQDAAAEFAATHIVGKNVK